MIRDVLNERLVEVEKDVDSWQSSVRCLGDMLIRERKIESEFVESMIQTVYKFGPYMILLPGVAFFHGSPGQYVHEPCLSFITLKKEVYFKEFDNQPIQCAFAFGAVDSDAHMQMLMQVTKLLQDQEFIDLAKHHGSKAAIMKKIQEY